MVKNLPASARDAGPIPGLGRSPGGENATQSSILAWQIPWTDEPGGAGGGGGGGAATVMGSQKSQT